jgi:hypothetical protein
LSDIWSEDQFREVLLAIHSFNKICDELETLSKEHGDLKQITRLKYYGLKLFKMYTDQTTSDYEWSELNAFGGKFNAYFDRAQRLICRTLAQSYRDILKREEGTAFSLPRDAKVWETVRLKFEENLSLLRDFA